MTRRLKMKQTKEKLHLVVGLRGFGKLVKCRGVGRTSKWIKLANELKSKLNAWAKEKNDTN